MVLAPVICTKWDIWLMNSLAAAHVKYALV